MQQAETLEKRELEDANVSVQLIQLTCGVSDSFPTGYNNLALLDAFRSGYHQGLQGSSSGPSGSGGKAAHHILKRTYGRGSNSRKGTNQRVSKANR
jgi:hypothetical protein